LKVNRASGLSDDLVFLRSSGLLEDIVDLDDAVSNEPLQQGHGIRGWVRFFTSQKAVDLDHELSHWMLQMRLAMRIGSTREPWSLHKIVSAKNLISPS
jgi:hypothetical protein